MKGELFFEGELFPSYVGAVEAVQFRAMEPREHRQASVRSCERSRPRFQIEVAEILSAYDISLAVEKRRLTEISERKPV
jgi:hypothetical protein